MSPSIKCDRDGPPAGGFGPTNMWWYANVYYFSLGCLVFSLFCPVNTVTKVDSSSALPFEVWMAKIAMRNLAITVLWYGSWHWCLYTKKVLPEAEKFLAKPAYTFGYCVGSLCHNRVIRP